MKIAPDKQVRLELAALLAVAILVGVLVTKVPRPGVRAAEQADSSAARSTRVLDALLPRVRVDTLRAVRWQTRYDSVRVTDTVVVARVDTVHHDTTITVYVPRAVADSTVRACTLARQTCGTALAAAVAATESLTIARDRWKAIASHRPWLACGPGVAVTAQSAGLAVACTYPVVIR